MVEVSVWILLGSSWYESLFERLSTKHKKIQKIFSYAVFIFITCIHGFTAVQYHAIKTAMLTLAVWKSDDEN